MGKRRNGIAEILGDVFLAMPWWLGPIVIAAVYAGLYYGLPGLLPAKPIDLTDPVLSITSIRVQEFLREFAPVAALPFSALVTLAWIIGLAGKFQRAHILRKTRGIEELRTLSWSEFELLVGEYYRHAGYQVEERGGAAPDGGIDLILRKDRKRVVVQCKHWKTLKVGVRPIRELLGVMAHEKADAGIFVASGNYTKEAQTFASQNRIELVGGALLVKMINTVRGSANSTVPSVLPSQRQTSPPAENWPSPIMCPACGGPMVLRTARTGQNAGAQFYGCKRYPACRGVRKADA